MILHVVSDLIYFDNDGTYVILCSCGHKTVPVPSENQAMYEWEDHREDELADLFLDEGEF